MKIIVERKDLCTKKQVIGMMKKNYLPAINDFNRGYNTAIKELIQVLNRNLIKDKRQNQHNKKK